MGKPKNTDVPQSISTQAPKPQDVEKLKRKQVEIELKKWEREQSQVSEIYLNTLI
jgi:hypothetical protein